MARGVASVLAPGDVVTLEGELGAGKTLFARGVAEALGVLPALVSSPTFVLVNVYPTGKADIARVVHVDAYRLTPGADADTLGADRLFDPHTRMAAADAVALVEWPDRMSAMLPPEYERASVLLSHTGEQEREITLTLPDTWTARPGVEFLLTREPIRCSVTGKWVSPTAPTYPFADRRSQDADLFKWFAGQHVVSREMKAEDVEGEGA